MDKIKTYDEFIEDLDKRTRKEFGINIKSVDTKPIKKLFKDGESVDDVVEWLQYKLQLSKHEKRTWRVEFTNTASKQLKKLPVSIQIILFSLHTDIVINGPERKNWKHYSKLAVGKGREVHHCHVKEGKPTYVAVWEVMDNQVKFVSIIYAGTRENAYSKI